MGVVLPRAWRSDLGDSFRGVRRAARRRGRRKAIDINPTGTTKDGKWIGNHWRQPLLHGFRDPAPRPVPRGACADNLSFALVHRFVTRGRKRHRSQLLTALLALAANLGVRVELEVKRWEPSERVAELVRSAPFQELLRRDLIVVKTLAALPGSLSRLEPFAALGVPTMLSFTKNGGKGIDRKRAERCVTYFRGKPRWV